MPDGGRESTGRRPAVDIKNPYLMFLGDAPDQLAAKTAEGVARWRPEWCVGQLRLDGCRADLGFPDMDLREGAARGARTLLVGVANRGGVIPDSWLPVMVDALEMGFDVASGLHTRLTDVDVLDAAARTNGRRLFDVRHPVREFRVGSGERRSGKRLLTVGTDCSSGKMFTALAIDKEMRSRGMDVDFRATGQTGIFIAGGGVSVDAVVADFISGAVEWLSPAAAPEHWDVIEGQGSLFHASFAGVSMGLLHGAQPDVLVMCHEPTRTHMRGLPHAPLPDVAECIQANLDAARLTSPNVRCVGVSVNTAALQDREARTLLARMEKVLAMPCVDAYREGAGRLVDAL